MKRLILFILFFLTTACSFIDTNKIAPGYAQAFIAIKNVINGYENTEITPELIKNIPYASSLVRVGKGPYGLMILESIKGDLTTWVSADGIYFILKKGKIIETKGFASNLSNMLIPAAFSNLNLNVLENEGVLKYYYTYDQPTLVDLEINAEYSIVRKENLYLLSEFKELTLVHEKISSNLIHWNVLNKYWVDENSYVWKSEQHVSPKIPVITFEITKKPSL